MNIIVEMFSHQVVSDDDDPFESEGDTFEDQSDDDYVEITKVEVLSDSKDCIIDLCESTLENNYTLAVSAVPEASITLNETFLPISCELLPFDVKDIILNL